MTALRALMSERDVMAPPVVATRDGAVLRLVLSRPESRNALSEAMMEGLEAASPTPRAMMPCGLSSLPPRARSSRPATTSRNSPPTAPTPIAAAPTSPRSWSAARA